jgi:enoyl-[acyl-carrier protein] reductase I
MVLQHKTALVLGVANQKSLAWSCALSLLRGEFNHVIVTYQNERFQKTVQGLVQNYNHNHSAQRQQQVNENVDTGNDPVDFDARDKLLSCLSCNVSDESQVEALFREQIPSRLLQGNGSSNPMQLNALVHCIAFAPSKAMKDSSVNLPFLNTDLRDFEMAHSISAHSLLTVSRHALPLLSACHGTDRRKEHDLLEPLPNAKTTAAAATTTTEMPSSTSSSITALTYLGSTRAVRNYNVMGPAKASLEACVRGLAMELSPPPHCIRVNAVSAGPVNTLAARGIRNFNEMRHQVQEHSFLKRCVTGEEVGNLVEFVAGSRASGITGQVIFCDGGYSSWGG